MDRVVPLSVTSSIGSSSNFYSDGDSVAGYINFIRPAGSASIVSVDGMESGIHANADSLFRDDYQASVGDIIYFRYRTTPKGPNAENIQWIAWERPQERTDLLFAVTRLGDPRRWLNALSNLAENERWYSFQENNKDILLSYLQHTFIRLCEMEGAISFFDYQQKKYMAFNTGLYSRAALENSRLDYIYAIFDHKDNLNNHEGSITYQDWEWKEFLASYDCTRRYGIEPKLLVADYGQYDILLFDPRKDIYPGSDHILGDRVDRFPADFQSRTRAEQEALIQAGLARARSLARQDYTIPILQFFRDKKQGGELQWLLPFQIFSRKDSPIFALPLQTRKDHYLCRTVLDLQMAYKNARLLRKPQSKWLSHLS